MSIERAVPMLMYSRGSPSSNDPTTSPAAPAAGIPVRNTTGFGPLCGPLCGPCPTLLLEGVRALWGWRPGALGAWALRVFVYGTDVDLAQA
eukprot:CAMPEP_0202396356 /NCGR_PEP_ID=MMETSP1127-20130417/94465_1 /ASSEMBLY_ACC=CAM_ASM_000462 /TAXON_ID=3047 /ORGANISM="Dunaliella tertiolecta, Strain CCMP1320" /LENGTH=90 /DNA_ID=CAMNT_0048999129 /DNA_START=727 /DNA_END=999 /DNA_ORIENTATION=+